MRWTEQIIEAHKSHLDRRPPDRRPRLISLWEQYQRVGALQPAIDMALELATQGNSNEVELGFFMLMDLAQSDASVYRSLGELAKHKSATVRRNLAFYLAGDLPPEFTSRVFMELLRDRAASVRIKTIETIGMRNWQTMMAELRTLRSHEQSDKVIQSLDYWMPLLEFGYRVVPSQDRDRFDVTVLTGRGIASRSVEASGVDDPRILVAVEEILEFHSRVFGKLAHSSG